MQMLIHLNPFHTYYICSCEFIWIPEMEPPVPPNVYSTVPDHLCELVSVCGSAIVWTVDRCSLLAYI
jgi:hypothetical protein